MKMQKSALVTAVVVAFFGTAQAGAQQVTGTPRLAERDDEPSAEQAAPGARPEVLAV